MTQNGSFFNYVVTGADRLDFKSTHGLRLGRKVETGKVLKLGMKWK